MRIEEHVLNSYDDHHMICTTEGYIPLKVLYHQGVVKLVLKVELNKPFKSMRISRYRSYIDVPRDAYYIDTVIVDGLMYHYFELES